MGTGYAFQGANARQNQQNVAADNELAYAELFGTPKARLRWEPSLGRFVQTQWDKDPSFIDRVRDMGGVHSKEMKDLRKMAVNQRAAGNKWWQPWRDMYAGTNPQNGSMGRGPVGAPAFTGFQSNQNNSPMTRLNSSPWTKGFQ